MNTLLSRKGLRSWLWLGVGLVVVVALVAASVARDPANPAQSAAAAAAPAASEAHQYAKGLSKAFHDTAEQVLPSVVMLYHRPLMLERPTRGPSNSEDLNEDSPFGDLFRNNPELRRFFGEMPRGTPGMPGMPSLPRRQVYGAGSGVIIDSSGLILTNNHVAAGDGKLMARLMDGREFEVADVKADPRSDLAVVRIKGAQNLKAAKLGDSSKMAVGDWVLALGNPFGLEGTVTAGIISAKGRGLRITDRADFLQTDASINPGNSGGPLVNLDGEVVGINTAISSSTGTNSGVGFAVPINMAKWVSDQLVQSGKVKRAFLGVGIQAVTQPLASPLGVGVHEGVAVTEVFPNSPAAEAGLKPGDVIVKYAGQPVAGPQELQGLVERSKLGQKETLEVLRDGKRMTLQIPVQEQPADYGIASRSPARRGPAGQEGSRFEKLGIEVSSLNKDVANQLGLKSTEGVVITNVRSGSLADLGGLESGMVILQANRKTIKAVDDLKAALESQPLDKGVLLLVRTADGTRFLVIRADKE